jgi:hypothetical protein
MEAVCAVQLRHIRVRSAEAELFFTLQSSAPRHHELRIESIGMSEKYVSL